MVTIEDLLHASKISRKEYLLYKIFENLDQGKEVLKTLMLETFNEEPPELQRNETAYSFLDGRRSIIRDIYAHIESIKKLMIKDIENHE